MKFRRRTFLHPAAGTAALPIASHSDRSPANGRAVPRGWQVEDVVHLLHVVVGPGERVVAQI